MENSMAKNSYLSKKLVRKKYSDTVVPPWEALPDPDRRLLDIDENEWDVSGASDVAELADHELWE